MAKAEFVTFYRGDEKKTLEYDDGYVPTLRVELPYIEELLKKEGFARDPGDIVKLATFEYLESIKEGENAFPWDELTEETKEYFLAAARKRAAFYRD